MAQVDVYECEKCDAGVEYETNCMSEYHEFKLCQACFDEEVSE